MDRGGIGTMPTPAEERDRFLAVENLIATLVNHPDEKFDLKSLFGGSVSTWQRRVISTLEKEGAVVCSGSNKKRKFYKVKSQDAFEKYIEYQEEIAKLAWPQHAPKEIPDEPGQSHQAEPYEVADEDSSEQGDDSHPGQDVQECTLKLLGAVMENLIYLREKVDELNSRMHRVEELWK